ncbi:unnamed protein product, partial [Laminaria digitata]
DIIVWSAKHDPETVVSQDYLERATNDRQALIKDLRAASQI